MTLQQLRCVQAVVRSRFSVSLASKCLHSSRSAVSKQIRQLERELGLALFVRSGRHLIGLTERGRQVHEHASRVLRQVHAVRQLALASHLSRESTLSIGTTHTEARYFLPDAIERFHVAHRRVRIELHAGTHEQISDDARARRIEFAVASGATAPARQWLRLPVYRWYRCVITAPGHPLTQLTRLSLAELARFRLITYSFGRSGGSSLLSAFQAAGLDPNVALTARDADVIKTYVRLGLGVGVVAETALDPILDADLVAIDATHLLPEHRTWVAFSRNTVLRRHMSDFVIALAPHLDADIIAAALQSPRQGDVDALLADAAVPLRRCDHLTGPTALPRVAAF